MFMLFFCELHSYMHNSFMLLFVEKRKVSGHGHARNNIIVIHIHLTLFVDIFFLFHLRIKLNTLLFL